jgi:hypothetical protein
MLGVLISRMLMPETDVDRMFEVGLRTWNFRSLRDDNMQHNAEDACRAHMQLHSIFRTTAGFNSFLFSHQVGCVSIFTPFHSGPVASSIHAHFVISTFSLTYATNASVPGAPSRIPSAPTCGICNASAIAGSQPGGTASRRVALSLCASTVDKWTSVGMCACGREAGGWLCGIRTRARGRGGLEPGNVVSALV